jgi:calcineurin-like phosphoesterase
VQRFLHGVPNKYEVEKEGKMLFNALFFEFDELGRITQHSKLSIISGE